MKTLGNIIWLVLGGLEWAAILLVCGLLCCVTIVGIPIGIQIMKLAGFVLWPFGKQVKDAHPTGLNQILNLIWTVLFGWEIAAGFLATGLAYCVTIIGIPFGLQYFKIALFTLFPLGHTFK